MHRLNRVVAALTVGYGAQFAVADTLYQHAPRTPAGLAPSSWVEPDDSDNDQYSWDAFVLPEGGTITEVRWRGGYQYDARYGRVTGFVIGFWASNPCCNEPDLFTDPVEYSVRGLSGEHPVGTFNGINMYEYSMTISPGFVAEPGVKYWIQIEGSQYPICDWGLATGEGGDNSHFRFIRGAHMYFNYPHDTTFSLLGTSNCLGAAISQNPQSTSTCGLGSATFEVQAIGSGTIAYQWEREFPPASGEFVPLQDGATSSWDGGMPGVGGIVSGSTSRTLTIEADIANGRRLGAGHEIVVRCTVANACAVESSAGASLAVCEADFDCDGDADGDDFFTYLDLFVVGDPAADIDGDGDRDADDFFAYLDLFAQGC